jgi:hypothetical protein
MRRRTRKLAWGNVPTAGIEAWLERGAPFVRGLGSCMNQGGRGRNGASYKSRSWQERGRGDNESASEYSGWCESGKQGIVCRRWDKDVLSYEVMS